MDGLGDGQRKLNRDLNRTGYETHNSQCTHKAVRNNACGY